MRFWGNLAGYQLVWLCAVIGAGRGLAWPGVAASLLFVGWQLALSARRDVEVRLLAVAVMVGFVFDGILAASGLADYATATSGLPVPIWMLALWAAFAMTLTQSLRVLQGRPWLAAALGAVGGPLAYLGAERGWQAVTLSPLALWALAVGWALAMPLLAQLARRWSDATHRGAMQATPP